MATIAQSTGSWLFAVVLAFVLGAGMALLAVSQHGGTGSKPCAPAAARAR